MIGPSSPSGYEINVLMMLKQLLCLRGDSLVLVLSDSWHPWKEEQASSSSCSSCARGAVSQLFCAASAACCSQDAQPVGRSVF